MADLTSVSPHDTPFTPADRALADNVDKTLKAFLSALTAWEPACKKYSVKYGQAADALTAIATVRETLNERMTNMLEGR